MTITFGWVVIELDKNFLLSGSSKCVSVVVIFFKLAQLDKPVDDFAYGFFVIRRELFTPGTMNLLDDR
jgi:hypothetical protein